MTANVNIEIARGTTTCFACRTPRCASGPPTRCSRRSARRPRIRRTARRSGGQELAGQSPPRSAGRPRDRTRRRRRPRHLHRRRSAAASVRRCQAQRAPAIWKRRPGSACDLQGSGGARKSCRAAAGHDARRARTGTCAHARPRSRRSARRARLAGGSTPAASGEPTNRSVWRAPAQQRVAGRSAPRAQRPSTRCSDRCRRRKRRAASGCTSTSQLKPVRVRLGISDGQATELIEGDLERRRGGRDQRDHRQRDPTRHRAAGRSGAFGRFGQRRRFPAGGGGGGGDRGGERQDATRTTCHRS